MYLLNRISFRETLISMLALALAFFMGKGLVDCGGDFLTKSALFTFLPAIIIAGLFLIVTLTDDLKGFFLPFVQSGGVANLSWKIAMPLFAFSVAMSILVGFLLEHSAGRLLYALALTTTCIGCILFPIYRAEHSFAFFVLAAPVLFYLSKRYEQITTLDIGFYEILPTTICFAVLVLMVFIRTIMSRAQFFQGPMGIPLIIYLIVGISAAIVSGDLSKGLPTFIHIVVLPLTVFFVITNTIKTEEHIITLLKSFAISVCLVSLLALMQNPPGGSLEEMGRSSFFFGLGTGVAGEKNEFARLITMIFPILCVIYFLYEGKPSVKILIILSVLVLTVCQITTFTKTGWISLLCATLFFSFFGKEYIGRALKALLFLSFIMVGIGAYDYVKYFFFTTGIENFDDLMKYESVSIRLLNYKTSLMMMFDYPLTGVGLGRFGDYSQYYTPHFYGHELRMVGGKLIMKRVSGCFPASHSFIGLGSEGGVMMLLSFAGIIFMAFKESLYVRRNSQNSKIRLITVGLIASLIIYCFFCVTEGTGFSTGSNFRLGGYLASTIISLIAVMHRIKDLPRRDGVVFDNRWIKGSG